VKILPYFERGGKLVFNLTERFVIHFNFLVNNIKLSQSSRTREKLFQFFLFVADRDQTVSRRFEPSSRTTLIDEQSNLWTFLRVQDVMSRHRGAKRSRQFELSGTISLLSLA